jgi:hypothetical protein
VGTFLDRALCRLLDIDDRARLAGLAIAESDLAGDRRLLDVAPGMALTIDFPQKRVTDFLSVRRRFRAGPSEAAGPSGWDVPRSKPLAEGHHSSGKRTPISALNMSALWRKAEFPTLHLNVR